MKQREIVSASEFDAVAEDFGKEERKRFGQDGFATVVDRIARFEREIGIHELAEVTAQ